MFDRYPLGTSNWTELGFDIFVHRHSDAKIGSVARHASRRNVCPLVLPAWRRSGCSTLQLVNHDRPTRSCLWQPLNRHPGASTSLSSGDTTLRAFNFNKLSISLNLDASNFFYSVSDSSSYTTPLLSFGLGATEKDCVSLSNNSHPFDCLEGRRVWFCHGVDTPVHDCLCL